MRHSKHENKMRWLGENMAYLEATYPGMWVAVSDQGFAGAGTSVSEATEEASKRGIQDPLVAPIRSLEFQSVYIIR